MSVEKLHKRALKITSRTLSDLLQELVNIELAGSMQPGDPEAYRVSYKSYLRGQISVYEYLLTLLDGSNGDWNINDG